MSDVLRTERLVLQPLSMSDHAVLLAHWREPRVRRYLFDGLILSAPQVTEIIAAGQLDFATEGYGLWGMRRVDPGTEIDSRLIGTALAGTAGLRRLGDGPDVEVVYSLDPGHWGQGYAAEATAAVLDYAFDVLGLDRVIAEIDEGNTASAALAERLGMRPYGTVPGALGPLQHYAIDRTAWPLPA